MSSSDNIDTLIRVCKNIDIIEKMLLMPERAETIIALKLLGLEVYERKSFCKTITEMKEEKLELLMEFLDESLEYMKNDEKIFDDPPLVE